MWSPTHIQVTVHQAKGLLIKGKNGTNNCFVTIGVAKEKYTTTIKEKATQDISWHEECELTIPDRGNRAELVLTCMHRNNMGIYEFLGQVTLPLNSMDVYDAPRPKWYKLQSKPGKEKSKDRGELQVRIGFTVKSGSLSDLSEKKKKSTVGGSLLSLGTLEKRKGLANFAKSMGSKLHLNGKSKKDKDFEPQSINGSISSLSTPGSGAFQPRRFGQNLDDADPGVISEDDDFVFDNLSHKSSGSSLNVKGHSTIMPPPIVKNPSPQLSSSNDEEIRYRSKTLPPSKPPRINDANDVIPAYNTPVAANKPQQVDEWEAKLLGNKGSSDSLKRRSWESSRLSFTAAKDETNKTEEPVTSTTAPTTPNLNEKVMKTDIVDNNKPKALPRSATLESIVEKEKEEKVEKKEKRFSKLKYFRKDKHDSNEDLGAHRNLHRQFGERIIIGHENDVRKNSDKPIEVSPAILKKYDGKTREEMMLIATEYENEVRIQKQKTKELEDYLDNLLLRVMETHPKILQNPYRICSTKSG